MRRGCVLAVCIFWALFLLPGHAIVRRFRLAPREAGLWYALAAGYAASFLLLSPVSLLCYALGAPLSVFSACVALAMVAGAFWLTHSGELRALGAAIEREPWLPNLLLLGLLVLQARLGGWLDGDATFHVGRMRVLLEHGFTNRDIYLSEFRFQHIYHSNLLFPVYASAAQLTGQSPVRAWFFTEPWAKLCVALGHYVLGYCVTRQRFCARAVALFAVTANAGETYTLYPNVLCVGFFLPMLLGLGVRFVGDRSARPATLLQMAALDLVLAQVHALYAVYTSALLVPLFGLQLVLSRSRVRRWLALGAGLCLLPAAPFIAVSSFAYQHQAPLRTAPDEWSAPDLNPPTAGVARARAHGAYEPPQLTAGGGHLEKVLDNRNGQLVFPPERMGGRTFVRLGVAALVLALVLWPRRRRELASVALCAALLLSALFTDRGISAALRLLQTAFVVARLSTVLSTLYFVAIGACIGALVRGVRRHRALWESALLLLLLGGASQLPGQAPVSFERHLLLAMQPLPRRHALLERLEARRTLLERTVPAGSTILTTARFARQVVMLRDCYVLVADRGHTNLAGVTKRRSHIVVLNASHTPWTTRARYLDFYHLHLVVFEHRWHRRYSWAYAHGKLLGSRAGLDVVELRR